MRSPANIERPGVAGCTGGPGGPGVIDVVGALGGVASARSVLRSIAGPGRWLSPAHALSMWDQGGGSIGVTPRLVMLVVARFVLALGASTAVACGGPPMPVEPVHDLSGDWERVLMVPEFGVQPAAHCSVRSYDISLSWDLLSVQASTDVDDGGLTTFDVDLPSEYMTFELPCQAGDLPVVRRRGPDLYWGATLRVPKEGTVGEWDIDMDVYSEYEGYFRAPGRCRLVDGATLECGIVEEGVDGELYMEGTFAFRRVGDDRKAVACDELLEWCLMHGGARP